MASTTDWFLLNVYFYFLSNSSGITVRQMCHGWLNERPLRHPHLLSRLVHAAWMIGFRPWTPVDSPNVLYIYYAQGVVSCKAIHRPT